MASARAETPETVVICRAVSFFSRARTRKLAVYCRSRRVYAHRAWEIVIRLLRDRPPRQPRKSNGGPPSLGRRAPKTVYVPIKRRDTATMSVFVTRIRGRPMANSTPHASMTVPTKSATMHGISRFFAACLCSTNGQVVAVCKVSKASLATKTGELTKHTLEFDAEVLDIFG